MAPALGLAESIAAYDGVPVVKAIRALRRLRRSITNACHRPLTGEQDCTKSRRDALRDAALRTGIDQLPRPTPNIRPFVTITFTDDPAKVWLFGRAEWVGTREQYWWRGSKPAVVRPARGAFLARYTFCVHRNWLSRVHRHGIGIVENALTLDATPDDMPIDAHVFRATWASADKAFNVKVETGLIIRRGAAATHIPDSALSDQMSAHGRMAVFSAAMRRLTDAPPASG